jgi:hypothetical protein
MNTPSSHTQIKTEFTAINDQPLLRALAKYSDFVDTVKCTHKLTTKKTVQNHISFDSIRCCSSGAQRANQMISRFVD